MVAKAHKKKAPKKRKKLNLKRAAQVFAKIIYKHLVKLPEEEREENIAVFERVVAKKFKRRRGRGK